jgi:predicted nucleic acid-binding protein
VESFSILTGGRRGRRLKPAVAARLLEDSVMPYVQPVALDAGATMAALAACEQRGVRGSAVYDWLHLAAARAAGADVFYTLNLRDFQALALPGDPRVELS